MRRARLNNVIKDKVVELYTIVIIIRYLTILLYRSLQKTYTNIVEVE